MHFAALAVIPGLALQIRPHAKPPGKDDGVGCGGQIDPDPPCCSLAYDKPQLPGGEIIDHPETLPLSLIHI